MMNNRAKLRKTENRQKTYSLQASFVDSDNQSTQSGALVGSNDDLLTEILLRVPVSSILRFKSVSKHWRSLLNHRRFTLLYNKVAVSTGLFVRNLYIPFDGENRNPPPFRSLDFHHDRQSVKILQSCNGLLLCCNYRAKKHTRKYYVCNPTTMQITVIPSIIGGPDASKTISFMGLAFHVTDCVHYKVVCFRKAKPKGDMFQIQIYSSDSGKWRISHESFSGHYAYTPSINGVYWNGAIHWVTSYCDILSFKLDVEQLTKLSFRELVASSVSYRYRAHMLYFGESRGHVHLVESAHHKSALRLNVYEMLSDHSRWSIKYVVELDELLAAYPEMIRYDQYPSRTQYNYEFDVFDVVRGEEEEDTFMVVRNCEKIVRFNILNKTFKQIFDLPNLLRYQRIEHRDVHRYSGTLLSF